MPRLRQTFLESNPQFGKFMNFQHSTSIDIKNTKAARSIRSLKSSRWPVSGFNEETGTNELTTKQNQRTRPSTTKPRRLTRTGTDAHSRCRGLLLSSNISEYDRLTFNLTIASRSPRPTDTLRSRAQIPSSEETTDMLCTER